jgi:PTH1 family peptidyl-tRNA hydrolase
MWLFVGLGNPGPRYGDHRHNVGFMALDRLAGVCRADAWRDRFSGEIARAELADDDAWLLKPMTYMNCSGDSVQPCAAFFKIAPDRIVVVHDELDLPFGTVRIKQGGGHGGHNGLRSLIERMGGDFVRVRVGIGRPPADFRGDVADFVLTSFRPEERQELDEILKTTVRSVLDIASRGLAAAMKRANTRSKPATPKPDDAAERSEGAGPSAANTAEAAPTKTREPPS